MIDAGSILCNGVHVKRGHLVSQGDRVTATILEPAPTRHQPEAIPLGIVYEDADLLVINKPVGLVVHPAPGHATGTLVNAVMAHVEDLEGVGEAGRPGIVHRLDRDTTGLIVVAKRESAYYDLQRQIQARTFRRTYTAIIWKVPSFLTATIDAPVGRHPSDRKRMAVLPEGHPGARSAVTEITVREALSPCALIEARLQTGRTHQIRVHLEYIGHPVVGDPTYRRGQPTTSNLDPVLRRHIADLEGQALHASHIDFAHPESGVPMAFEAPLPDPVSAALACLRLSNR